MPHSEALNLRPSSKLSNQELGTLIFIGTEVMFFVALFSAYLVIRSKTGNWVPPNDILLPIATTGINTLALLISGVLLYLTQKEYALTNTPSSKSSFMFLSAIGLGVWFVGVQGYEWIQLVRLGLTINSGIFGACFFLIIGCHGIHALFAIGTMSWFYKDFSRGELATSSLKAMMIFWSFVVGIWPIIYWLVYIRS